MLCNKAIYRVYRDASVVIKPSHFFSIFVQKINIFLLYDPEPLPAKPGQNVPVYALLKFGTHLQCKMYEPRA